MLIQEHVILGEIRFTKCSNDLKKLNEVMALSIHLVNYSNLKEL